MALINDISHIITCLYKLSIPIRNPVPPGRLRKLAAIDVSHLESKDIEHLSKNFPLAPVYALERLRKGNTKRRQLFKYYQLYHDKLARYVDLPPQDDAKSTPSFQLVKQNHGDTAGTCPTPPKEPGTTTLEPQTTPSTDISNEVRPEIHEGGSAGTSHSCCPASDATLTFTNPNQPTSDHVPPPPNVDSAYTGQPFECPYCCTLIALDSMRAWK